MKGTLRNVLLLSVLAVVVCALVPMALLGNEVPDVEVRTVPWRTHGGKLMPRFTTGQGFRCEWNGLARIEVGLVSLGPARDAELELVLHDESARGAVLRRSKIRPGPLAGQGQFASFEFDPVADSAGRDFWFELVPPGERPSPYSAWIRYHGQPGHDTAWGNRIQRGPVVEGPAQDNSEAAILDIFPGNVPFPNLSALAFAVEHLDPAEGEVRLELWRGFAPEVDVQPLRSVELRPEEAVRGGYAFFAFEPIADSRWQEFRYRLTMPESARLVAFEAGPSLKTFHGGDAARPPLLGVVLGDTLHLDRSLIFRAHSSPSRFDVWQRIARRAGWKLGLGALAWALAIVLIIRLYYSAPSPTR